jgi:hypothetical protein
MSETMSLNEAYGYCHKLEKDRNYVRRKAKKRRIQVSMLSLDDPRMRNADSENSPAWESDNGKGAEEICTIERVEEITIALQKLPENYRTFAEAVLSGKTWREMRISRQAFWKRMKKIETFFVQRLTHPSKTIA